MSLHALIDALIAFKPSPATSVCADFAGLHSTHYACILSLFVEDFSVAKHLPLVPLAKGLGLDGEWGRRETSRIKSMTFNSALLICLDNAAIELCFCQR